jgi:methionyl aminopeptidase
MYLISKNWVKSAKRVVPSSIPRPDYADHPQGHPLGEIAERGSTVVKVLDDEEIEGLKVACKVNLS